MNEEYEYEYEYDEDGEEAEYYAIRPNKTQIKKEYEALFDLADEMSKLSPAQLKKLELPEKLHHAVTEVSGMPHKGARKRLLKYIAGQFHKIDMTSYSEKLAKMKNKSAHAVREHHLVERWRDGLIAEGNEAVTGLLDEYPHADRQLIRQLVRNAQKEAQQAKPPKSSRQLYRYLKELFDFEGREEELELDEDREEDDFEDELE